MQQTHITSHHMYCGTRSMLCPMLWLRGSSLTAPTTCISRCCPHCCCWCYLQGPKCLDPALLPNQVRGCCREPCSTLITTAGQNISGVCCKQGATNVTAADGTTSRICCADGFPAQTDGTCCKTPQQCTNSVGFKFCCPPGQTCQGGQCLDITIPTNNCTAPNVTCNGLPNFTPGGCCRNETCLQVFDPTPPPGAFLGNNATGCCPEVRAPAARHCTTYKIGVSVLAIAIAIANARHLCQ
jgi:hypothetical protein